MRESTHNTESTRLSTLSIVIPCYNEKETITRILDVVQSVNIPYHKEIIIVDDCSKDGTREILQSLDSISLSKMGGGGR
ncbi:glycosyltransferase family 2 protein [uncultured Helicobacter sp.]|uniref:glycosyltransferase family 2 protein n=1 Tax=uncultured Helicobacter sp. TaxID=175537 RepID=UPI00374F23D0